MITFSFFSANIGWGSFGLHKLFCQYWPGLFLADTNLAFFDGAGKGVFFSSHKLESFLLTLARAIF